jgi:hypothetical protein
MRDERGTSVWPWFAALITGFPLLYVASFGPACWCHTNRAVDGNYELDNDSHLPPQAPGAYWPIGCLILNGPQPVRRVLCWYVTVSTEYPLALPCDRQNSLFIIPDE